MNLNRVAGAIIVVASLLVLSGTSVAQNASKKTIGMPGTRTVPSLIVMNAAGAKLEGNTLTLTGIARNAIMFADRPVRSAGHAPTVHLLDEWAPGRGSFAKDPPNATVSVLNKEGARVEDAVVVLKEPKLSGDTLTFKVEVLESNLAKADGPASIFIDTTDWSFTPDSAQRTAQHSAWYQSSAPPIDCGPPWNPCF
ncbi:hypothetical protein [Taklimakanibacter deserti]|uniref:hypothetical protein n=1 Tax=Taklimakanibacter deserti TaxID=2267839 RepID=UPI000E6510BC